MSVMRGPFSLSINEETGLLVEGFDEPPVGHVRRITARIRGHLPKVQASQKAKDCYGWRYEVGEPAPRAQTGLGGHHERYPRFEFRTVDPRKLKNAGPRHPRRLQRRLAAQLGLRSGDGRGGQEDGRRPAAHPRNDLSFFAEIDGQPVGDLRLPA